MIQKLFPWILVCVLCPSCYNYNVYREVGIKSRQLDLRDVEETLLGSGQFVDGSTSDLGRYVQLTLALRDKYSIHFSKYLSLWVISFRIEWVDGERKLLMLASTRIGGVTCKEIPIAVDLLRDCHSLLLMKGLELDSVEQGISYVNDEKKVTLGPRPKSILSGVKGR